MIGITLLIFGYGIYELVISGLDPHLECGEEQHTNILSVKSIQSLKNNLSREGTLGIKFPPTILAMMVKTLFNVIRNAKLLLSRTFH